jgi:hypothetical protein
MMKKRERVKVRVKVRVSCNGREFGDHGLKPPQR